MDERGSSGDEGLDRILGGGLPLNGINLIMGRPGSGKTILCQQFMFARATEERPAVYLSTVSEPFEKILRYAQTLSFFDRGAIGRSIFYEDLGPAVAGDGGLAAVTERIGALIKEHRPGIIAIDSFKALAAFADDARGFRRFLHELAALLTVFPATSFWIGEYSEDESRTAPEFAVADGIISLATERVSERTLRLIEVTKLRGSDFRSGRHAYRLSTDGITVFPRLADPLRHDDYRLGEGRISTGIAPLDTMLAEGYAPGSSTLVAGPSGIGKTLMALHFIFSGAANGEPGVIASLQENPIQLERVARGFGWSLDHRSRGRHVPVPQRRLHRRMGVRTARAHRDHRRQARHDRQPQRPAVRDPRSDPFPRVHLLAHATPLARRHQPDHDQRDTGPLPRRPPRRIRDLAPLRQRHPAAVPARRIAPPAHRDDPQSRASAHDPAIREFEITPDGIILGDPIASEHV